MTVSKGPKTPQKKKKKKKKQQKQLTRLPALLVDRPATGVAAAKFQK